MGASDLDDGFLAVLTAPLLAAQVLLQPTQLAGGAAKKFRRCGVCLAAVTCLDNSASDRYGNPRSRAFWRARKPSLNTTRAQPNALASDCRWAGVGYTRYL